MIPADSCEVCMKTRILLAADKSATLHDISTSTNAEKVLVNQWILGMPKTVQQQDQLSQSGCCHGTRPSSLLISNRSHKAGIPLSNVSNCS